MDLLVDPMEPVPYRVCDTAAETGDVRTLTLEPVERWLVPPRPGQFVMVWAPGVGDVPISVSAMGHDGRLLLTVRVVGAVSAAVVGAGPGTLLGLRGPFGSEWPLEATGDRRVVVVAGGLGLAPLRIALDALCTGPVRPRSVSLIVGAREPSQLLYPNDLERWEDEGVTVHATVDTAPRSWHGAVGTATAMLERLGERHDVAFVCGPELMMTSSARAAIMLGVAPADLWVSLERNMHCGIAKCGRCQLGPYLLCRDGAIVSWDRVDRLLEVRGR